MINLKKHDPVADAVNEILQQEALKGNQHKIDANHNNEVDTQDFKILRAKKKVKEEIDMDDRTKDTLVGREKTKQKDDVGPNSNAKVTKFKLKSEEAEQIDEISTSTLGSYLDKRKSEYMKGKTQSGSKENAKKIQNMGKAYDKIKVQDLAKARQNNMEEVEQIDELSNTPPKYEVVKHLRGTSMDPRSSKPNNTDNNKTKDHVGVYSHPAPSKELKKNFGSPPHKIGPTLKQMKERMEEPILDELINEVMSKDASAGAWIHDFVHSDNPKFAGKSTAKRKEMALGAYYSKKNEETVNEGLKDMAKKTFKALTGGSDKDHLDRLKKDMYGGSEVKYAAKTLVKHAKDPLGLKKEEVEQIDELSKNTLLSYRVKSIGRSGEFEKMGYEAAKKDGGAGNEKSDKLFNKADSVATARKRAQEKMREDVVEEGWDDMVKAAQEKVKSGPKPSGGSGKKEGSRYGGSKQKEKPEQEVKEGKDPNMDAGCGSQPNFATDMTKPMKVAQKLAKNSLGRMRNEMMGKKNV